jgi:PAS domain S-box-containing protein
VTSIVETDFRDRLRLSGAVCCAAMIPLALWLWMAIHMRASALDAAMDDQRRAVDAIGEHALKLLDTQALLLDVVDRTAGNRDCPALRSDAQFQDLLRLFAQQSPDSAVLGIINGDGHVCMASDPQYVDERDRSFREYFGRARDAGTGRHYVDRAILGMTPPIPVFSISKARWRDGAFNGIIVASPSLADLIDYWDKTLDPTRTQRISLFRQDGATIARSWPPLVPPPDPEVERRVVAEWTAPQGTNSGPSVIDGGLRVGAWRTLPDWNVVVSSSENEDEVLAPWRRSMFIYGALAALVSTLLGTLAWLLLRGRQTLERTVAERTRALRTSEARLKLATAGAGVGTWEADFSSGQGFWSPETIALLGVQQPGFTAESWLKEAVHPSDRPRVAACWAHAIADGAPYEIEFRPCGDAAGGEQRWLSTRGRIERGTNGRPVRAAGILIDVTMRRQAEAALAQSEARLRDLNRTLEERVREEVSAREDAQARAAHAQRMQALGQLAGGIAHDFNNVLQTVQGAVTLIAKRAADPASVKKFAAAVLGAVERGASITRRLLAFARRGELRAERIDLAGLLDGLRDVLAQTLGSPITVRINNDGTSLPAVIADRGQLETVLVNLATNARDAMPGGGTLTFAAVAEEFTAGLTHPAGLEPGQYVRLSVTDTGIGMDQATLVRAMEPFFTTKPQDKGTGLGLSMAKGFAEQSGGALAIDSAPGKGTTVMLWLPVADEQQQVAQVQLGLAPVTGLARRILLVDDENMVRETLAANLEDAGFSVLAAGSGAEAVALLDAGEPVDAMVSDLSMPGMDGLALTRQAQTLRPDLPAILLTGFAGEASQLATGTAARSFSLLRKPASTAQLIDRIEAVLAAGAPP